MDSRDVKQCRYCKNWCDIHAFSVARVINGKVYRRHRCHTCKVRQQKERRQEIAAWLKQYKQKQQCCKCGINDFRVLQFDHLFDKLFNLGEVSRRSFSKKKILAEIAKCQILCANCHSIKTYNNKNNGE